MTVDLAIAVHLSAFCGRQAQDRAVPVFLGAKHGPDVQNDALGPRMAVIEAPRFSSLATGEKDAGYSALCLSGT